jgi:hypothetical protein
MATPINHPEIDRVIRRNLAAFRKTGVLTVRPGYKLTGGWITDKPSIVATVDRKLDNLPAKEKLPAEVEDVPVDVREATGLQRLRHSDPTAHALVVAHGRGEIKEPVWRYERRVSDGKKLVDLPKPQHLSLSQMTKKTPLHYRPPPGQILSAATRPMTIIAHASPEDGYPVLTNFLAQVKDRLTVAMYDFTSADLLAAVEHAVAPAKPFEMVLDHPPRNQTANQTDDVTRQDIIDADGKAKVSWALTRNDPKATAWIFPTAYHIKVAVRDGTAFWLSSGNFNVSNQPNLAANDPKRGSLKTADRDWHVIVLDQQLAELYEAFITSDFQQAAAHQGPGSAEQHGEIRAAMLKHAAEQKKSSLFTVAAKPLPPSTLGMQKTFDAPVTIQPLLTPDAGLRTTLYVEKVLDLIKSAQRRVYMQTQYVHPSDAPGDTDFMTLVAALAQAHKDGRDVRLITSQYENTGQWLEKLKEHDIDQFLRIQDRVHNKGIVVDSEAVLVSSENWSADGTLRNRDAGLIIHNAAIAQYFEAIFLDDWTKRARESVVDKSYATRASRPRSKPPPPKRKAVHRGKGRGR